MRRIQSDTIFPLHKVLFVISVFIFVLGLACPLFSEEIVLIHSNDIHGIFKPYKINIDGKERLVGGMEAASHYLNEIRAREKNVLVIEKGDLLTGTLAAEIEYKGVIGGAMMEFLNRLDYDIWCLGNHDFDKGQPNALALTKLARFPTVMANIVYKKSGKLFGKEPYHILKIGRLKVGIIAVMEENFLIEVQKENVQGLDVLPVVSTLKSYIPRLDKKTDLIVVLSHGWFEQGIQIAESVPGIDIVLAASEDGQFKEVNGVLVQSIKGHLKTFGYLKVEVEEDRVVNYEKDLAWLWADVPLKPSPRVSALVKEVDEAIGVEYSKVIGKAVVDLTIKSYPKENPQPESSLGNWITDVMRWKTGAQLAFHNSGAIRADIMAGPVTKVQIFRVAPFHNILVVFKLTGQQIKDVLEYDVERGWDRLQVSGLRYKHYPKVDKPYGKRIFYIEVDGEILLKDGKLLHPDKVFSVVSNDYLVGQAKDKYFGFSVKNAHNTGQPLDKAMMEWLEKYKVLDYKVENRIEEIKSSR
jgi:5'-nucleotidase/UDP-sugar diphosphatase